MKLLSVSLPDTCGLYNVYVMPFFELGFFSYNWLFPMIGYLAVEFADGTPDLRAMLVHDFSSGIEIN